jgi:hypothetical protein
MYAGTKMGNGQMVPVNPQTGQVNINAIINGMVSRDIWTYYSTVKLDVGQTFAASYSLFNQVSGSIDQYAITANQILSHVETNMPAPASNGFPPPKDLILDHIGNYFLSGGCGTANHGIGTFANISDMLAFCQYSYIEFKILDKVFAEGFLELYPPGVGFTGVSTQQTQSVYTLGFVSPHAVQSMGKFSKYLAPQMQWSYTIYFPAGSGPAGVAGATLTANDGGNGLWLKAFLQGLTDRAVQ